MNVQEPSPAPRALDDWLAAQSLETGRLVVFLGDLAEQLEAHGLPLLRLHISRSALDPSFSGTGCTWRRGQGVEAQSYTHREDELDRWQESPIKAMIDGGIRRMRRRLTGPQAQLDYPVLAEFRDEGATDWIAYLCAFVPDDNPTVLSGMVLTATVDAPDGLTPAQEALLDWLAPRVGGIVLRLTLIQSTGNLVETYIGNDAGRRILKGQIKRGDVVRLPAVLMIADLRGFTALAESTPPEQVIAALNEHLGPAAEAVAAHGGEVLKFLGDGLLAVFSLEERPAAEVCESAFTAAESALAAIAALEPKLESAGLPSLAMDIALHLGEVLYGNVGAERRLDFTVIGPAVNQASRIEALCQPLGQQLLLSESFAKACRRPLQSLGEHPLRGVAQPQTLYTLTD